MLKRLYIDNFRSLVNFELQLDSMALLLGANGSGKTAVFDVLHKIQQLLKGSARLSDLFLASDLTAWDNRREQTFEITLLNPAGETYLYTLRLGFYPQATAEQSPVWVKQERLTCNGQTLLNFQEGAVQLFGPDAAAGPSYYAFDKHRSALETIQGEPDTKFNGFHKKMQRIVVLGLVPSAMAAQSAFEQGHLERDASNFASWYRHALQQDPALVVKATEALQASLLGFQGLKLVEAGGATRLLQVQSQAVGPKQKKVEYALNQLSDGQRALIVLYLLLYYCRDKDYVLCLDEPENFLALREIQPWLSLAYELCTENALQMVLISHHPEVMNYLLTEPVGHWLERPEAGPTRVQKIAPDATGLPISELVARGWLHA